MQTLEAVPCQQDFPGQYSREWSQAGVVPYQGQDSLMVCGGRDMPGCFVWQPSAWEQVDTTFFNGTYARIRET